MCRQVSLSFLHDDDRRSESKCSYDARFNAACLQIRTVLRQPSLGFITILSVSLTKGMAFFLSLYQLIFTLLIMGSFFYSSKITLVDCTILKLFETLQTELCVFILMVLRLLSYWFIECLTDRPWPNCILYLYHSSLCDPSTVNTIYMLMILNSIVPLTWILLMKFYHFDLDSPHEVISITLTRILLMKFSLPL